MKLKELFNAEEIAHPSIFFSGTVALNRSKLTDHDYFEDISKPCMHAKGDKKTAYKTFMDKYYYDPIAEIFERHAQKLKSNYNARALAESIPPQMVLTDIHSLDGKRSAHLSYSQFLYNLIVPLSSNSDELKEKIDNNSNSMEGLIEVELDIKDAILDKLDQLLDVKVKGSASPHYSVIMEDFHNYMKSIQDEEIYDEYLNGTIDILLLFASAMEDCYEVFKKPLDFNELMDCFTYENFCLAATTGLLESCIILGREGKPLEGAMTPVLDFINAVKKIRAMRAEKGTGKYTNKIQVLKKENDPKTGKTKTVKETRSIDDLITLTDELMGHYSMKSSFTNEKLLYVAKIISRNPNIDMSKRSGLKVVAQAEKILQSFMKRPTLAAEEILMVAVITTPNFSLNFFGDDIFKKLERSAEILEELKAKEISLEDFTEMIGEMQERRNTIIDTHMHQIYSDDSNTLFIAKAIEILVGLKKQNITIENFMTVLNVVSASNPNADISLDENAYLVEQSFENIKNWGNLSHNLDTFPTEELGDTFNIPRSSTIQDPEKRARIEAEREERLEKMNICHDCLEIAGDLVLLSVKGMGNFAGYTIFMYKNGMVILEPTYANIYQNLAAKDEATYVMSAFDLVELTKNSKTTLIQKIRELKANNEDSSLNRIAHDWKDGLVKWRLATESVMNKDGKANGLAEYINMLIASGVFIKANEPLQKKKNYPS